MSSKKSIETYFLAAGGNTAWNDKWNEWNKEWVNPWDQSPKDIYPYIPGTYTDNTMTYHDIAETIKREFNMKIEILEKQVKELQLLVKTMIVNDKIKVETIEAKKIILVTEDGEEIELDKETVEKFIEEHSKNKFNDILSK